MAYKAPKVQTVAQAMKDLNPAYSASKKIVNQRIGGLDTKYDAQRAALTAEKGQGFNAINNQATGRGASFSGIPLDEQARYLSTKYLPGMQQADYQQNDEGLTLQGRIADMNKEQRLSAIDIRQAQKSDLNSWNSARASEAAAAKEARLQREFTSRQNAADRAASAARAAASRAASAPSGPSRGDIISGLNDWAQKRWGNDKNLSPGDFRAGYQKAAAQGMSLDDYNAVMYRYINTSHTKDYIG